VKGFAFEEYSLLQILRYPSQYLNGVPAGTVCNLVRFRGDHPTEDKLNSEGLTLFWPNKFNLAYVDAVVRYVHSSPQSKGGKSKAPRQEVKVDITGVQVTIRALLEHRDSLLFFAAGEEASGNNTAGSHFTRYLKASEQGEMGSVSKRLAWVALSSNAADYPPSDDCEQFVAQIDVT
jgi:hypothetical protein